MKPHGNDTRRGISGGTRRIAALAVIAAALAVPASAQAITVSGTSVVPADPTAGAHSDINIHMDFSGGQVKDLTIALPPGVAGDPTATPKCTVDQLNADACPADSVVGSVSAAATVFAVPVTVNGSLFNLVPQAGEPARFGIVLHALPPLPPPLDGPPLNGVFPPIILQSAVQLRQTDFGLSTVINNIPKDTAGLDTTINSQDITLFGIAPGTLKPFMRNPTSCGPATTTFTAVPYSGATGEAQASFNSVNCGALPFSPTFSAKAGGPGLTAFGTRGPVSTLIQQDAGEAGLRTAAVTTPVDFVPDFYQLDENCQPTDFNAGTCPPGTVVGSAVASSPALTEPLTGPVILVKTAGLPNIGLDLSGQLNMRLQGGLGLDNAVTFDGLPDIPISDFQLTFSGGPTSLLTAGRDLCKQPPPMFPSSFVAHSGATTAGSTAATIEGCGPKTAKCKKVKKKRKKGAKSEAVAAKKKKGKKKKCKRKKRKKKKRG